MNEQPRTRETIPVAEKTPVLTRPLSAKDIMVGLKWILASAFLLCLPVSLILCWHLQKKLDEIREEQKEVQQHLASLNRLSVVEQSGVFKLEVALGRGKPVYFPRPYDAPPTVTIEALIYPFANVGGEVNKAKLEQLQKWDKDRQLEQYRLAMKAFELGAVYTDHFNWEMHIDRAPGGYPLVEVKWKARGLIGSKGKTVE